MGKIAKDRRAALSESESKAWREVEALGETRERSEEGLPSMPSPEASEAAPPKRSLVSMMFDAMASATERERREERITRALETIAEAVMGVSVHVESAAASVVATMETLRSPAVLLAISTTLREAVTGKTSRKPKATVEPEATTEPEVPAQL